MASHTFCRAKPLKQQACSASEALAIVQELLNSGVSSLPDDARSNLYNVEAQLEVLKGFPEPLIGAARQQPAATASGAAVAKPTAGAPADKKERRKERKQKDSKGKPAPGASEKEQKKEKSHKSEKRRADGSADEDQEKRKKKKQKTAA